MNVKVMNVNGRLMYRRDCSVREIPTPGYTEFSHLSITQGDIVYTISAGPKKASCVLRIDLSKEDQDPSISVVRTARDDNDLEELDISEPELIEFQSDGVAVFAWFYKPKLPPVLLLGHGGPTSEAVNTLDLKKQFFTSRGFAVLDVNYRGSTGFGTAFRNMLKRQWGIVDRDDMIAAARSVIARRLVDEDKVCILGSSAGGYLVLSVLIHSDIFKAAVSIYGVADLVGLAKVHRVIDSYEGHGFRGSDAIRRSTEASYVFLCKALGITPSVSSDVSILPCFRN
uniref:Peptidase_S9 domain-containing protein n=1 Tax=Angiostrongylus cantonensis TaxID=6313 RepID=A0A158PCB5_ANGCA